MAPPSDISVIVQMLSAWLRIGGGVDKDAKESSQRYESERQEIVPLDDDASAA